MRCILIKSNQINNITLLKLEAWRKDKGVLEKKLFQHTKFLDSHSHLNKVFLKFRIILITNLFIFIELHDAVCIVNWYFRRYVQQTSKCSSLNFQPLISWLAAVVCNYLIFEVSTRCITKYPIVIWMFLRRTNDIE